MSSSEESHEFERERARILAIIAEVERLAASDMPAADFFRELLERIRLAMNAVAGLVWTIGDEGRVEPVCHFGVPEAGIAASEETQAAHGKLVEAVFNAPGGLIVPPRAQITDAADKPIAANPTDLLVLSAPIERAGGRTGLIEVFHHSDSDDVQRGYLGFLQKLAAVAGGFLEQQGAKRQLVTLGEQQTALAKVEQFARKVHESLEPQATAYTIASEARQIIGCDRVGVLVRRGRKLRLDAVSGQTTVERRASAVQAIEALVRVVARAGEPLWHPDPGRELPPQIEEELENYIDESHATALAIIPLEKPRPTPVVKQGGIDAVAVAKAEAAPRETPEPIGALVVEWFSASTFDAAKRARVDLVADHGRIALSNALSHTGLPLYGLLNLAGKSRVLTTARNLPKTVLAALATAAALAALVFVPAELRLEGKGTLQPVLRRDVFARIEGVVESLEAGVEHGAAVQAGQPLLRLRNTDLEVARTDALGKKAASEEQLSAVRRTLLTNVSQLPADERTRLEGQKMQLDAEIRSLDNQIRLLDEKRKDLVVTSPIEGVIVTWQVKDRLLLRPVEKGQVLLTVADKSHDWELELHLPDDRLGHVNRAYAEARAAGRPLAVDYILATDPGTRHFGTVREIHEQAEVHGEQGNTALVRVEIDADRHETEQLGAGASVTARIACGKRPLGYVWFHDVLAFIRTQILFRIF